MKKAYLFDLDGTLWDNTANAAEAWARALCSVPEHPPAPTQEDIRACCGYALPELAERHPDILQELSRQTERVSKRRQEEKAHRKNVRFGKK